MIFWLNCVNPKSRTLFFPFCHALPGGIPKKLGRSTAGIGDLTDQRDTTECNVQHTRWGDLLKGCLIWVQEGESGIGQLVVSTCIVHHLFFSHSSCSCCCSSICILIHHYYCILLYFHLLNCSSTNYNSILLPTPPGWGDDRGEIQ